MKTKLTVYLIATLATVSLLCVANAIAQSVLDPTQSNAYPAYPAYLDHSCGGVRLQIVEQNDDTVEVRATTTCSTGGRGTKSRTYLACWVVAFDDDHYTILSRENTFSTSWVMGQTSILCPAL